MFDDVGGKLQVLAKINMVIGIIASIAGGIVVWVESWELGFLYFLLITVFGSLGAYISSLFLYAFGELVSNSSTTSNHVFEMNMLGVKLAPKKTNIEENTLKMKTPVPTNGEKLVEPIAQENDTCNTVPLYKYCGNCGKKFNVAKHTSCPECGAEVEA